MKLLGSLAIAALAVLAPIKAVLIVTFLLVLADLITGVWAAVKTKQSITSAGFRRTLVKMFIYEILVITGFLVETYLTGNSVPISKLITSFIGLTETLSIIENLNIISETNLFATILAKLGAFNK